MKGNNCNDKTKGLCDNNSKKMIREVLCANKGRTYSESRKFPNKIGNVHEHHTM